MLQLISLNGLKSLTNEKLIGYFKILKSSARAHYWGTVVLYKLSCLGGRRALLVLNKDLNLHQPT